MRVLCAMLMAAAGGALFYLWRRQRAPEFVSREYLAGLAMAGDVPEEVPGPRGLGRRDLDAVERAERSTAGAYSRPMEPGL